MPDTSKGPEISLVTRARSDGLLDIDQWAFAYNAESYGFTAPAPGTTQPAEHPVLDTLEWDRTFGAWLDRPHRLAGIYSVYSTDCPLPGGTSTPAAGLTWVGVHPRDRRRGVLTAMIGHHLDEAHHRGEPISLLHASEPPIYGRFGYGPAAQYLTLEVDRGAELRDVPGAADLIVDLDHADVDRWAQPLAECYAAAGTARPGWLSRDGLPRARYLLFDPPPARREAESLRVATASTVDGDLRGYAVFRRRPVWENGVPQGTVEIEELVARDAAASRALWGVLADLDLTARVRTSALAVDDPLRHLLVNPRAAQPRLNDGLYLRLVDLPAALTARRYQAPIDVVLQVHDRLRPVNDGRWRLTAGPDGADCAPTSDPAQVELDVRELGSTYLGGIGWTELAGAGLVTVHDPEVLEPLSIAFGSTVAPFCPWMF